MVVVFNLMIGLLTPPMGLALFLVADIAKVTMKDVLKEMAPYYVPLGSHAAAHHLRARHHDVDSHVGARQIDLLPRRRLRS